MAWTAPATYVTGQVMEASDLNLVRDNLRYLKGLDGDVTFSDSIIITDAAGNYVQVPSMTTANLPAAPAAGMVVFDSTVGLYKQYINGAWASLVGQTAVGSAGQFLKSNGAGATPSWDNLGADVAVAPGTYTGNSTEEQILITVAVPTIGGILHVMGVATQFNSTATLTLVVKNPSAAAVTIYGIYLKGGQISGGASYTTGFFNGASGIISAGGIDPHLFHLFLVPAAVGNYTVRATFSVGHISNTVTATAFWTP